MSDDITPGVWEAIPYVGDGAPRGWYIGTGPGGPPVAIAKVIRNPADARLIAAAKRMLAELGHVRALHNVGMGLHAMNVDGIRRALQAATGAKREEDIPPLTDGQRLAFAHLDGDVQASLLLADEVQMAAQAAGAKAEFVPRAELERQIEELREQVLDLGEQLHRANDPNGTTVCVRCDANVYDGSPYCADCHEEGMPPAGTCVRCGDPAEDGAHLCGYCSHVTERSLEE